MRRHSTLRLLVLALAAIFSIALSACGGTSGTGSTSTSTNSAKTVTLVTDTGGINDQSFNEAAYKGYEAARAKYGYKDQVIQSTSESDYIKNLTLAAKSSDLTIAVGFLMATATDTVAKSFPAKHFALIDACPTTGTSSDCDTSVKNVAVLFYKEQEAGCLVGAAAGEIELLGKSKMPNLLGSNTIAAVGGVEIPPVDHYIAGYQYCAKQVDPNITVLVNYSNSFSDTAKCQDIANSDVDAHKADIIFQVAGGCGNGALQAAKAKGVYSIGVDSDQSKVNDSVITSAIKRVDVSVSDTITNFQNGQFTANPPTFDLKHNGVGYAPFSSVVPAEVKTVVDVYSQKIISGKIQVPDTVSK
jgi:Uncharacterized ABC-type transport system, periplasmic component/surface lipoprotein